MLVSWLGGGCALTALAGYRLAPNGPTDDRDEAFTIEGLREPVSVTLDAQGVPHLEAKNLIDLARATGFMQGRARFFQMDLLRRLARGRLAALIGAQPLGNSTTVATDLTVRWWGLEGRAQEALNRLPAEQLEVLEAFAQGVNAAVTRWTPLEHRLLQLVPEPWQVSDTVAISLLDALRPVTDRHQELVRLLFAMQVGFDRAQQLAPDARPFISAAVFPVRGLVSADAPRAPAPSMLPLADSSLAFVVPGARSRSGKPLLVAELQLSPVVPGSLWQQHLTAPGLNVIGVTLPGLPWVLAGHTDTVAFGSTSSAADAVELIVEREDPTRPGFVITEGGNCALTSRDERISVRDGPELLERTAHLRSTCNGPLINDVLPQLFPPGAPLVAMRLKAEGLERALPTSLQLNTSSTIDGARNAIAQLPTTGARWTVADVEGHVGHFVSGEGPSPPPSPQVLARRTSVEVADGAALHADRESQPAHVVPSSAHAAVKAPATNGHTEPAQVGSPPGGAMRADATDGQTEPTQVVPPSADAARNAHAANGHTEPPQVVPPSTAAVMHAHAGDPEPAGVWRLPVDVAPTLREQRVAELSSAPVRQDPSTLRALLADTNASRARALWPVMRTALGVGEGLSELGRIALQRLSRWNFDALANAPEAAIFFQTYRDAVITAVSDELPAPAVKFFLGQRASAALADRWFAAPDHPVWDDRRTPAVEGRDEVLRQAFTRAVAQLAEQQGVDLAAWRWGRLHTQQSTQVFGDKALLFGLFSTPAVEADGEPDSVWSTPFDLSNEVTPFKVVAGPSSRLVIDLGDLAHGLWVVDSGSSGWPGAAHVADQAEVFRAKALVPMLFDLDEVKRGPHGTLVLRSTKTSAFPAR